MPEHKQTKHPLDVPRPARILMCSLLVAMVGCGDSGGATDGSVDANTPTDSAVVDATDGTVGDGSARDASDGSSDASQTDAATPDGGVPPADTVAWVMSYFGPEQNLAADSLHLAYSVDGLHWSALAGGAPAYLIAGLGTNHIRDPFLFRKRDGTFIYIATDWTRSDYPGYWDNPSPRLFVADSVDLITFTNPRLVEVTNIPGTGGKDMHAWAPEVYYDPSRDDYAIVWSGNDAVSGRNKIYVSYTDDFTTILNPTPDVLFDPGYDVIDATIVQANGYNYLLYKDETGPGKDIQIARSSGAGLTAGTFTRWDPDYITRGSNQGTPQYTEGPLVVKMPGADTWYMYADFYGAGGVFGCWRTSDLDADPSSWTRLTNAEFSLPNGVRHANTVRVTQAELDAMVIHYGVASRLRTTYGEGGNPFYVAHSYYRMMITNLADRANGQEQNDFLWRMVPGLADPENPDLVSFEAVGWPGRYLRIDSQNPNRYPSCTTGTAEGNRGFGACNYVDVSERNHLGWIDPIADSATFRSDATFERVPALNGNAAMVSFRWHGNATRYLRHIGYQVFAHTVDGTPVDNNDASFTIE